MAFTWKAVYAVMQVIGVCTTIVLLILASVWSDETWSSIAPGRPSLMRHLSQGFFVVLLCCAAIGNIYTYYPEILQLFGRREPVLQEAIALRQRPPWDNDRPPRMVRRYEVNGHAVSIP